MPKGEDLAHDHEVKVTADVTVDMIEDPDPEDIKSRASTHSHSWSTCTSIDPELNPESLPYLPGIPIGLGTKLEQHPRYHHHHVKRKKDDPEANGQEEKTRVRVHVIRSRNQTLEEGGDVEIEVPNAPFDERKARRRRFIMIFFVAFLLAAILTTFLVLLFKVWKL